MPPQKMVFFCTKVPIHFFAVDFFGQKLYNLKGTIVPFYHVIWFVSISNEKKALQ